MRERPLLRPIRLIGSRTARLSISKQVLLLQLAVAVLLTAVGTAVAIQQARSTDFDHARAETLALAETIAAAPGTAAAVQSSNPTPQLQPIASSIQQSTSVNFVVIMSPAGIRYTHPNPDEIGKHYIGDTAPALAGHPFSEVYTGTLGPSVRSVAPIYGADHKIVGLVSVGITLEQVSTLAGRQLPLILAIALGAVALVGLGSWALSRRLSKQTLGLGPQEITRLYEHHDAVLHAMHEGLLVLDRRRRVLLVNDEALRLLDFAADDQIDGRTVTELGLDPALTALLGSGRDAHDETHLAGPRVLAVNQSKAVRNGRDLGTVVTLRDHTELRALAGELDSARAFADALSASAHEAANRLHTVVTLIELDRPADAVRFATTELAASQGLIDRLLGAVGDEAVAALLLGKISQAAERGVEISISEDTAAPELAVPNRDLITILGNLIDNAVDAAAAGEAPHRVAVSVCYEPVSGRGGGLGGELSGGSTVWLSGEQGSGPNGEMDGGSGDEPERGPGGGLGSGPRGGPGDGLRIRVADSGRGIKPEHAEEIFNRGWTTKNEAGHGIGLALVRRSVDRNGGEIVVAADPVLGGAVITVHLPNYADGLAEDRAEGGAEDHSASSVNIDGADDHSGRDGDVPAAKERAEV
jgi:two-component system CitB family sensor kinase